MFITMLLIRIKAALTQNIYSSYACGCRCVIGLFQYLCKVVAIDTFKYCRRNGKGNIFLFKHYDEADPFTYLVRHWYIFQIFFPRLDKILMTFEYFRKRIQYGIYRVNI